MDGAIDGSGWLIVTLIAALGIVAWGVVIGVLFLRKAMIIGTVVFGPFAMAGLASGKTKSWAVKWVEVVVALALSKFVICVILTLAYSAVGVLGHRGHHRRPPRVDLGAARRVLPAGRAAVRALRRRPDQRREHLRRRPAPWATPGRPVTWARPGAGSRRRRRRRDRRVDRRPSRQQPQAPPPQPRPRRSAATAVRQRSAASRPEAPPRQRVRSAPRRPSRVDRGNATGASGGAGRTRRGGFGTTPVRRTRIGRRGAGGTGSPGAARDGRLPRPRPRSDRSARWSPRRPRPPTSGCRRPRPTGCSCSTKPSGVLGPATARTAPAGSSPHPTDHRSART